MAQALVQEILKRVKNRGGITFYDLGHIDGVHGNRILMMGNNKVLWSWLSERAVEAITFLVSTGEIVIVPVTVEPHYTGQKIPPLPIADMKTSYYDEYRFLPCCLFTPDQARRHHASSPLVDFENPDV